MADSVSIDELMAESSWLRALAYSLVRDAHAADDVVQDTWVSALGAGPVGGGLRGWLRRVLVNRVRLRARQDARRRELSRQLSVDTEAPSTLGLVERTQLQELLIQTVLELEEPYRTTVLERYYEGVSSAGLAARHGVPESTIRNRLRRGLARLRERLRKRHGGDDVDWLLAVAAVPVASGSASLGSPLSGVLTMSKPKLVAAIAVVAVVGCGLWSLSSDRTPDAPGSLADPPVAEVTTVVSTEAADVRDEGPRRSVPVSPAAASPGLLRVVDEAGRPVPGARVAFAASETARSRNERSGGLHLPHSTRYREAYLAETYGTVRVADARGDVVVPELDGPTLLAAWSDDRFGSTSYRPERIPDSVTVLPEIALRLRTIDVDGEVVPLVPVRVAVSVPGSRPNTLWTGTTGADGVAAVRHFQLLRPASSAVTYGVCLDYPADVHEPVCFGEPLPDEPVDLVVRPSGTLRLQFGDASGRPLPLPVEFYRLEVEFGEGSRTEVFPRATRLLHGRRGVSSEPVEIKLGVGARVRASGQFLPFGSAVPKVIDGPRTPGETVDVTLTTAGELAVARGRASPPAATGFHAVLSRGGRESAHHAVQTGVNGEFAFPIRCRPSRPDELYLTATTSAGEALGIAVALTGTTPGATLDLGEVELVPLPEVTRGQVVDDLGTPLARAELEVFHRARDGWIRDHRFGARTTRDGRFRLRADGSALGVRPRLRGYVATETTPVTPSQPLSLRMVRAATVAGTAYAPAWLPRNELHLELTPVAPGASPRQVRLRTSAGVAAFRVGQLLPGRYDLALRLKDDVHAVARVAGIRVGPGEVADDARLRAIDLRDEIHRYGFRVVDEADRPLSLPGSGLSVGLARADGRQFLRWRDDVAELITARPSVEVRLEARGFETATLTAKPGDTAIRVRRLR